MTTLMVIGVVAALTIPSMMQSHRERVTVTKVKQAYAILNQAYKMAVIEHGEYDDWEITSRQSLTPMKPYLNVIKDCTGKKNCVPTNYKSLMGDAQYGFCNRDGNFDTCACIENKYFLNNGMIFYSDNTRGMYIVVDIDGIKGQNTLGHDLFRFKITNNGIISVGQKTNTYLNNMNSGCQYGKTTPGSSCALWIIEKGNMDYLHKEISW